MTQQDKDSEFEAYLRGKSTLSDSYADLPQPRLPDHLDAAILAEAHRAVGARPGAQPRRSWLIPVSMAASLFVLVIVGLQLRYLLPQDTVPSQMRQEEKQKAAKVDQFTLDQGTPVKAAPPAAAAPVQQQTRAPAEDAKSSMDAARRQLASPEPERKREKEAPTSSNKPMEAMSVAPAAPAEANVAGAGKPARQAEQAGLVEQTGSGNGSGNRLLLKNEAGPSARADSAPPAPATAAPAVPEAAEQVSGPLAQSKAEQANLAPKEWLARIRQLKLQGKPDEAKKELAVFKKRYPDYPVPKDIEMR